MTEPEIVKPDADELIRKLHERPQMPVAEWLRAPAHVHYKAFQVSSGGLQDLHGRDGYP